MRQIRFKNDLDLAKNRRQENERKIPQKEMRNSMSGQSLTQVNYPLTVREKLMAITDEEFSQYESKF